MMRPEQHLIATTRQFPELNKTINEFRQDKGKGLPDWANFCFMPIAGWYAITCQQLGKMQLGLQDINTMQQIAAVGTWQFGKGVYQFDEDLYKALIGSKIDGDLPSEVLHRLPEWSLYVETPNLVYDHNLVYGFYAWLEQDQPSGRHELRILLDMADRFISVPLHLGQWSVKEAVDRYLKEANLQSSLAGYGLLGHTEQEVDNLTADIMPVLSLLLYICGHEPDLSSLDSPNEHPSRPQPKKTKKGWRLFPAQKVKRWVIGQTVGQQLRQVYDDYNVTGRTVKAHLRRGHHKTYWTGKRNSDEQKPVSRWIPPAIVGGN